MDLFGLILTIEPAGIVSTQILFSRTPLNQWRGMSFGGKDAKW